MAVEPETNNTKENNMANETGPRMDLAPEPDYCSCCGGCGEVCANCEKPKEEHDLNDEYCDCEEDQTTCCRECEGYGR